MTKINVIYVNISGNSQRYVIEYCKSESNRMVNSFSSRLLFWYIITNLFNQILEFVVVYLGVQDCFNKVFIFTINLN
jgi:hypothetical protein